MGLLHGQVTPDQRLTAAAVLAETASGHSLVLHLRSTWLRGETGGAPGGRLGLVLAGAAIGALLAACGLALS